MSKTILAFIAGIFSGSMIFLGIIVFLGREKLPGGEVLIIPLIVLVFTFGWQMGIDHGTRQKKDINN